MVATRGGEHTERFGVNDVVVGCPSHRGHARMQRRHTSAQPMRQECFDLRQRAQRGFFHAADGGLSGVAKPDGDRYGLVVVEDQGRHVCPRCQSVAPVLSRRGIDQIAQVA